MNKNHLFTMVLVFLAFSISAQIALDSGLVTYYPFNGNANDESGIENNGTVFGATLTTDRFGNENSAYNFDGNDYIKASADSLPTAERTTTLWFYTDTISTRPVLLGYGGKGYPGTSWWLNINHGGVPAYFLGFHYSDNYLLYYYPQEPLSSWVFFVATTDSSGSRIYINAKEMSSFDRFVNNTHVTGKDLAVGVCVSGGGIAPYTDNNIGYFKGKIDDVRIYNRALSDAEIVALYDTATGVYPINNVILKTTLKQNFPNPFNSNTLIRYYIPHQSSVVLNVHDITGKILQTLYKGNQSAGSHSINFNANSLPGGYYFYSLKTNNQKLVRKMLLVK